MKVGLITGSRFHTSGLPIFTVLSGLNLDFLVLGDAKGADTIALDFAKKNDIKYKIHYAEWDYYRSIGKVRAAGHMRNKEMLKHLLTFGDDWEKYCIAFPKKGEKNNGTRNMYKQCMKYKEIKRLHLEF